MKKTFRLAILFSSFSLPMLSHAGSLTCNHGAMTVTEASDFDGMGWYRMTIHDDGVANYFQDAFQNWSGGVGNSNDCYNGVCNYAFSWKYINVEFLMTKSKNGYEGLGGNYVSSNARFEGRGLRVTMNGDDGKSVNWFFEECSAQK